MLGMGVFIGQSTQDLRPRDRRGQLRPRARRLGRRRRQPARRPTAASLYCAVIVKQVDAKTRAKTSINELLRAVRPVPVAHQDRRRHRQDARRRTPRRRAARLPRRRTCSPASPPARSTASRTTTGQRAAGRPGDAQLRAAGPPPVSGVAVHVGQPRRLPRHPRRQEAEARRHRQHRRHGDQGRLPRRHEPDVLRRHAVDPGAAPGRHHVRGDVARHPRGPARRAPGRHRRRDPEVRRGHDFSVVREFCGHGIGRQFHEEPQVLHYGRPGTGARCSSPG